ncbi:MAG: hypothetical protein DRI36_02300 [Caldiserica bacterium]|nr:MAG: hypothetical protein DRI36_02300 [Caldisericota bacterium]
MSGIKKIFKNSKIFFGTFPSEVRPDYVDEDVLKIIKKFVYNRKIIIGAQSGSERILKIYKRAHSVSDILNAVYLCKKLNFEAQVDFIFGFPEENEEDLNDTLKIIKEIVKLGGRIHAHYYIPLPGTESENKRAKEIPEWFKKEILKLEGKGKIFGKWKTQMLYQIL